MQTNLGGHETQNNSRIKIFAHCAEVRSGWVLQGAAHFGAGESGDLLGRRTDIGWYQLDINVAADGLTEVFALPKSPSEGKIDKW